jgi:hypothetical protein
MLGLGLVTWRSLPLATQEAQLSSAALVEQVVITLPLDHAAGLRACRCRCGCNRGAAPTR